MDDRAGDLPAAAASSSRLPPTSKNDDTVIGLRDDLIAITDRLCGESSKRQVIPIVGMAGIGKTTLARQAYNDPSIKNDFAIRIWITVSQDYSALKVLSTLLASLDLLDKRMYEENNESIIMRDMKEKLHKYLIGRRYLVVMDDVWSMDAWYDVRNMLPDDKNKSRIMLTTRLSNIAANFVDESNPLHEMRLMGKDQSWNLLKHKVFSNSEDSCPPELEDIGKEIARSCRGLPLAIVVVAGVLSKADRNRASWQEIAKDVNPVLASREEQFAKILSLSYTNLPHHLRPCFLFIGGFPEDYEIHISGLIKLWAADGFLKRRDVNKSLEEEAEEYLEELVKRSLVLVTSRKTNGRIKCCSLHDMVRELCIRKAQEEKFLLHVNSRNALPRSIRNERRVSISHSQYLDYLGPTIHTVISFQDEKFSSSLAFVENFRLLRVLDLVNDVNPLPYQVFELFHLRYLALRNFVEIPAAISKLENLQTLIIHPRSRLRGRFSLPFYSSLPLEIWKMPQLRHLVFFHFYELPDPADGSALPLENLHTLSPVVNLVCGENILRMIRNVKKLGIVCNKDDRDYHLYNLVHLDQLEKLKITVYPEFPWRGQNRLAFPSTLKKLTLVGGRLPLENMAMIGSLPNLEVLKLIRVAVDGNKWETSDGEFPQLKFLLIEESHLQHWTADHFPTLERLVLRQCLRLREIPEGIGEITTLELIEVDDLNLSLVVSAKKIQKHQQEDYANDVEVRCIRHQAIDDPLKEMKVWLLAVKRSFVPRD